MHAPDPVMDYQSLILVVDDDPDLRRLVSDFLVGHGYRVNSAGNGTDMRRSMEVERPDLVILDVMMPGEDGLGLARKLAAEGGPPVIILSALGGDTDRIIGLEIGCDDYLAKPCNPRELLARARAVLRRSQKMQDAPAVSARWLFAGWQLDPVRRELRDPAGTFIHLSVGEFSLLRTLVEHPQRVLTRDQLLEYTRGPDAGPYDRAIDSQISRLRRKLNERAECELIRTVRNEGYMLLSKVTRHRQ